MSKIYIDPLNLGSILIDRNDKSDHEPFNTSDTCFGEMNAFYGKTHTAEVRKNQSESMKGEKNPNYGRDQFGEKNHFYGKKHSEETLKKMSKAQSGEKHPLYGKKHSTETRQKMSIAAKNRKNSANI